MIFSKCAIWVSVIILTGLIVTPTRQAAAAKRVAVDGVKIAVNDKVLTGREVLEYQKFQERDLRSRYKGSELEVKLKDNKQRLIDRLVEELLLESHAKEIGVEISDKTLNERVESIISRDPKMGDLYSEEQLKTLVMKDLLQRQVVSQEVERYIRVTDKDIYQACMAQTNDSREIDVGHILIQGNTLDSLEKINAIRARIEKGEKFDEVALANSQDPSAKKNKGRLGYIGRGNFVKPFEDKAFSMKSGELSEPVLTQFGYHIIKVFGERTKSKQPCDKLDKVARQSFNNQVYLRLKNERMDKFIKRLRSTAEIKVFNP